MKMLQFEFSDKNTGLPVFSWVCPCKKQWLATTQYGWRIARDRKMYMRPDIAEWIDEFEKIWELEYKPKES